MSYAYIWYVSSLTDWSWKVQSKAFYFARLAAWNPIVLRLRSHPLGKQIWVSVLKKRHFSITKRLTSLCSVPIIVTGDNFKIWWFFNVAWKWGVLWSLDDSWSYLVKYLKSWKFSAAFASMKCTHKLILSLGTMKACKGIRLSSKLRFSNWSVWNPV